jgi:hypothetical protein
MSQRPAGRATVATLLGLVHDAAAAAVLDEELNRKLGDDEEPIAGADFLARYRAAKPREVISEQEIQLWCFAENGNLIGDQDAIFVPTTGDGNIGFLRGSPHHKTKCVRRRFKQIEFHPAESAEHIDAIWIHCACPAWTAPVTHRARKSFTRHLRFSKFWID